MSITGPGSITAATVAAQNNLFNQLNKLGLELGTGEAADTYAGLGSQAGVAASLGAQVDAFDGYATTATTVGTTLTLAQSVLTQLGSAGTAVEKSIGQQGNFALDNTGQTSTQESAANYLDEITSLLNTQAGSNYLFSGEAVTTPSVASASDILNGNGTQAGLTQVIAERLQADQGADGLGRLVIPAASGSSVSISEDAAGSPFGFKLASVSSSLTGATVTGPSGSPASVSVALGANPNSGDTIAFDLTLPDGSTQTITLQATTTSPPGANQFTIGATASDTASNLQTALSGAVSSLAQTALPPASAMAAANNFFSSDPPQRVSGPPFDTATSLVDGTSSNTVFWYTGENGTTPAQDTATAQVGPNMTVSYGMRANEQAITTLVANVAVLAATTYSASDPNAQTSYQALCQKVSANLDGQPGTQQISDIEANLANAQTAIANASTLNTQTQNTLQDMLQGIEGVDQNTVGVEILNLQNSLSASMSITARLSQLSLVNYLGAPTAS
jgi:flagellar hook-associated protein 3 FlgL